MVNVGWFWLSRYTTVSDYPDYSSLLNEWKVGILYTDTMRRTVPMAQLEQDLTEGKQVTGSAYEPWRVWSKRKQIHEKKIIIYSMLGALMQGKELEAFMKPFDATATDVVEASKGKRGAKPCYMSSLLKALEKPFQQQYGTPKQFEENVLKWKLTEKAKAQAASKKKAHN